ncbi:MAG TPA: alpha/beta hydrolase [Thermomicrobiales bacterium]|nr:alpha/beta hydrolase [Thermomicrobiales bacterium]
MLQQIGSVPVSDGRHIAYQRSGSGPPLVLVHGTADDHTIWTPLLPALTQHFTVYAIDRRGRGGSSSTDSAAYAIEREFEDVAAVINATGEPAYLLGHSYGALCALEAAQQTRNLRRLVLYEPPFPLPPGSPISPPGTLEQMEALLKAGDREGTVLIFARDIAQLPEAEITAARSSPGWQATIAAAPTLTDEIRAVESYTFDPARFRHLTTPTLLMLGSATPPFLQAATNALAAALPNSQLTVLPDQGHLAMFTAPDLFTREVVQFLTEQRDAAVADAGQLAGRRKMPLR